MLTLIQEQERNLNVIVGHVDAAHIGVKIAQRKTPDTKMQRPSKIAWVGAIKIVSQHANEGQETQDL